MLICGMETRQILSNLGIEALNQVHDKLHFSKKAYISGKTNNCLGIVNNNILKIILYPCTKPWKLTMLSRHVYKQFCLF